MLKRIFKASVAFVSLCAVLFLVTGSAGAASDRADRVTVCHVSVEMVDEGTYLVELVEISISRRALSAHLENHAFDITGDEIIDVQDELGPCLDAD